MTRLQSPQRKWASDRTLAAYFEVNRATIWRWVKIGKLPRPVKIGENCTRFDMDLIEQSIANS